MHPLRSLPLTPTLSPEGRRGPPPPRGGGAGGRGAGGGGRERSERACDFGQRLRCIRCIRFGHFPSPQPSPRRGEGEMHVTSRFVMALLVADRNRRATR